MFTKTTLFHKPGEGGGSGGDQHNLGWYATPEALRTAHATATAGDWAIVGSTDTVWIWDTDTNAWKDSDQKGQVASVNGQTGTVVLTASDVGAATAAQGALADTAIQSVKTINGQSIVGTGDVTVGGLPDQTDQSGKFLTTDGSSASWGEALRNESPGYNIYGKTGLYIRNTGEDSGGYNSSGSINIFGNNASGDGDIVIGLRATDGSRYSQGVYNIIIGNAAVGQNRARFGIAIGYGATVDGVTNTYSGYIGGIAIGFLAKSKAPYAIQLGYYTDQGTVNEDANTFKVANPNGNFEIMSADGTIPEARLADTTNAAAGQVLTLDSNLNAVWAAGGSGGGSVPTLTWYTVSTAGNTLTIADTSSAQLVKIYKNGVLLQPTEDYTISGTTLTTVTALVVGDKITTEVF